MGVAQNGSGTLQENFENLRQQDPTFGALQPRNKLPLVKSKSYESYFMNDDIFDPFPERTFFKKFKLSSNFPNSK